MRRGERVVERVSEGEGESVGECRVMKGEEGGREAVERMEEAWEMEEVLEGEGVLSSGWFQRVLVMATFQMWYVKLGT